MESAVNANILTGSTSRGAVVIWELREGSTPVIVGRR